jgi:hypothetical protein
MWALLGAETRRFGPKLFRDDDDDDVMQGAPYASPDKPTSRGQGDFSLFILSFWEACLWRSVSLHHATMYDSNEK